VNLESGGFYCFGCDAKGGDVVAFLRLRECCDFPTACKLLGCWDNVDENERRRLASEAETRKRECGQAAQVRQTKRMQRLELRAEIHALVKIETKVSDRLTHLLQGAPPASENEVEDCWGALSLAFEDLRNCEAAYMAMIGSEYSL